MRLIRFLLPVLLAFPLAATEFYVAPNGSPSGDGSISKPWDLPTGIEGNHNLITKPGDTIWMRGGSYIEMQPYQFNASLSGTATAPIIIRAYPGERPTIFINNSFSQFTLGGQNMWIWGLEFTASSIIRYITDPTSCNANGGTSWCGLSAVFADHSPGTKVINCVVHDISQGFSFWDDALRGELYGTVIFNNGWNGYDRGHGHSIYTQNKANGSDTTPKVIADNILFNAGDEGIQAYGSGNAAVSNYLIQGNTIFNNGILEGYGANYGPVAYQILVAGGGETKQNIKILDNAVYTYNGAGYNTIGWGWDAEGIDVTIQNNIFMGSPAMQMFNWESAQVQNNTVISGGGAANVNTLQTGPVGNTWAPESLANWGIDGNTYYATGTNPFATTTQTWNDVSTQDNLTTGAGACGKGCNFATWQASGMDKNGTFNASKPTGTWIFVRPNKYEVGRANVTIYNWGLLPNVNVDVSSSGVKAGDKYILVDAQNYYGSPVASGTWTAGQMLMVPMTNTIATQALGMTLTIKNTQPQFGTFIFLAGSAINGSGTNPTPISNPVSITSFVATPNPSPKPGAPVQLNCVTVNSTAVTINGVAGATQTVTPSTNTSYACTATGNGGPALSSVNVAVTQPIPTGAPAVIFTGSPATLPMGGGQETLTWQITGATSASLSWVDAAGTHNGGAQPANKTATSTVLLNTTYTLLASNAAGSTTKTVTVTVGTTPPPPPPPGTFALTVFGGTGSGTYAAGTVVNIRATIPAGQTFVSWTGAVVASPTSANTTLIMPAAAVTISATFAVPPPPPPATYALSVIGGTGSGAYSAGAVINISAAIPTGQNFVAWTGATVTNPASPNTTLTMPAAAATVTATFITPPPPPPPPTGATAIFLKSDLVAEGSWKGVYGADGEIIANDSSTLPPYAAISFGMTPTYTWPTTPDLRALQTKVTADRIPSAWYGDTISIDLNLAPGVSHQVALYLLDWDFNNRAERIDILDAVSGAVLNSQNVSNFAGGQYFVWTLSGHVTVQVVRTSGNNAVVSGVFFN